MLETLDKQIPVYTTVHYHIPAIEEKLLKGEKLEILKVYVLTYKITIRIQIIFIYI